VDRYGLSWCPKVRCCFNTIPKPLDCIVFRLHANDQVDPYVALYEHTTPSLVHDVTHLQWSGLLHPAFVQKVLDTLMYVPPSILESTPFSPEHRSICSSFLQTSERSSFVGITSHALTTSPVSYIPYTTALDGTLQTPGRIPAKLPRRDSEDTWSLILERAPVEGPVSIRWCLGESLGQWDARWG
jgi:ribonuclease P/MRP protein subunit RPP40